MLERLLNQSRWLVIITVVVSMLSALLLYAISLVSMGKIVVAVVNDLSNLVVSDLGKATAVSLLKILDVLLIAVTLQIIAMGMYRLFIRNAGAEVEEMQRVGNLQIHDFHQLKATVIHMSTVILVIMFLERAVEQGQGLDLLYFGLAVAVVIFTSVWAADKIIHTHRDP